ncbi:segregation/condensation protein A [Rhodobacteraceae bacterium RKSG542]|uniref:segregation and condensation protein A n=1 Tax=Pseudovibrio flavus TaxID=2529854 RepID=UPI0012BBA876|nr:ScpA family protein [Pseudovibrio flavus]MTI15859.1 segregation/condensation protein A [Pseudovibrio flavus]
MDHVTEDTAELDGLRAEEREPNSASGDPLLHVDLGGYEGPLDLLLTLARSQKVDLTRLSILQLAEQYLAFVQQARQMRLEIAADYLVMAAWLAYLKSRLLVPKQKDGDEPTGEELAAALAFRLQRLEAMREASQKLIDRNRLGRDIFARGAPEVVSIERKSRWTASLYDILSAYASQRQRRSVTSVQFKKRDVLSLQEAREILNRLLGGVWDWTPLERFLLPYMGEGNYRNSVVASTFSASLELAREGVVEIQQTSTFGPILLRSARRRDDEIVEEQVEAQRKELAQEEL